MRKVRTASGAVAVQIITRQGRQVLGVQHLGSAHTDAELEVLVTMAEQQLSPGQGALDLGVLSRVPARMDAVADWTRSDGLDLGLGRGRPRQVAAGGRLVKTSSVLLWQVLAGVYTRLGFDVLADEAFRAMVLARIVEPTSKAEVVRVLGEIGAPCPSLRTLFRALGRCQARDYRDRLAKACLRHSATTAGFGALCLYDVTTLHFENETEDDLRKVGMSKEHRVDPQVQVGLLVDPSGFPLEVHLFEGNRAETKTLIPVLAAFQARHGITDMVVVADAGMLSAANLNDLQDAGFAFIVGSRLTKAPYDLAEHFARHGDHFSDGQILESVRTMGTGKDARSRRIVYQYSFKRHKRDDRTINAQIAKADRIAAGQAPLKKTRFLKVSGATKSLDEATIARARQLAGLKGYVTCLDQKQLSGAAVIAAYHDLWQVEASFRMVKSDLRARPVFHHQREAIEAHLTVVFAALAVSRYLTTATGKSIRKIVRELRAVQTATIEINGQQLDFPADTTPAAAQILSALTRH